MTIEIEASKFNHLSHRERSDRIDRRDPGEGLGPNVRSYPLTPTLSQRASLVSTPWERGRAADVTTSESLMSARQAPTSSARAEPRSEPRAVRLAIIAIAVTFLSVFVVLPLVVVFAQAFSKGIGAYF